MSAKTTLTTPVPDTHSFFLFIHDQRPDIVANILRAVAARLDRIDAKGHYADVEGGWMGHFQTIEAMDRTSLGAYAFKPRDQYRLTSDW